MVWYLYREKSKSVPIIAFRYASNSSAFLESKIKHFVMVPIIQFKMAAIRFARQDALCKKKVQQVAYLLTQDSDYRLGSHVGIQNGVHEFYQRYQMTQFLTFTYQIPLFTDSRATYRFGTK